MTAGPGLSSSGRRLGFITLGCKVNQYESAFMAETAARLGFLLTPPMESEFLVVNTCTVTSRTDRQVRQLLRQSARLASPPKIIVTGCYAQRAPGELAGFPGVRAVLGNLEKALWPDLLPVLLDQDKPLLQVAAVARGRQFSAMPLHTFYDHTRAFVKIQDGCNHLCSYCIVPSVRGPERSLPPADVLKQLEILIAGGFKEIVLTGINLSRYGRDLPGEESLWSLVRRLKESRWPGRFRLSSLEPEDLSRELLRELAGWPQFCPHFHIPLQSGSPAVLTAMGRAYQPDWFEALIREIAALFPTAAIGLDLMVGFPTESEADFNRTRELVARLPVSHLHVFPYSMRPGTPAASLRPLSGSRAIRARAKDLRDLGLEKKREFYQRQVGQVAEVLIEGRAALRPGWVTGLTANYVRVHLPGPEAWANQVVRVRLEKMAGQALTGVVLT